MLLITPAITKDPPTKLAGLHTGLRLLANAQCSRVEKCRSIKQVAKAKLISNGRTVGEGPRANGLSQGKLSTKIDAVFMRVRQAKLLLTGFKT